MNRHITRKMQRQFQLILSSLPFAILLSTASATASAQETAEPEAMEEVVVIGIRNSLTRSMDIKRNESGVVDAISAEDIGKFPDANLAESLQRITGVSIDRQSNEGNQISVRGLGPSFNMVTLNGRQMPVTSSPEQESISSATQSRAFNFAEIASESVTGVNVYKTARPDVPSGGMGATVDIRTARPFDFAERTIVANISALHDSSVERGDSVTPEIGGMFSTVTADGRFGVLVNGSYSKRDFSEVSTHTDGWLRDNPGEAAFANWCENSAAACAGIPYIYRPVTNISELQHNERERTNGQFVAQFAPNDDVVITLDYVLSRFERAQSRYSTGLFGVVSPGVFNLELTDTFSVARASRTSDGGAAIAADAIVYENQLNIENDSVGLNIAWQAGDNLSFEFDAHSSQAVSQPGYGVGSEEIADNTQILQGALGIDFDLTYSPGGVDIIVDDSGAFRGEDQFGGGAPRPGVDSFMDPDGFSPLGSVLRNIAIDNEVDQFQFKANWDYDTVSVMAGLSYTDYQVETLGVFTGFQFQDLDDCNGCSSLITNTNINAPGGFDVVAEFPVNDIVEQTFPLQLDTIIAANPPVFFGASEESLAAFVNLAAEIEIGRYPARLSAGFRYEDTDVTGSAFQTFPEALEIFTITEGRLIFPPGAEPEFFEVEGGYEVFLPALDFQIEPKEDWLARLSYGKTIARPDLNALRPITTVSDYRPGIATAAGGNPNLRPYISDNIDLALEWYYAPGSYAAVTFFYKQVGDYIATRVEQDVLLDVNGDPLLNPEGRFVQAPQGEPDIPVVSQPGDPIAIFDISRPTNAEERSIDGWEFAVQHMFGDSGFGMQANYTVVSSDAEFDPANFQQQAILIGLSDSANLVAFYETDLFSIRAAANWRDDFLFAENQLRATNEAVFFDSYLQFDLSAQYAITDNLQLAFEALNITGEDQVQRGRYNEHFLFENDQEPRYTIGVRASF